MDGRDPAESHRAATPLELMFDLTFVVAYGMAADELAHYLAEDHIRAGVLGFAFGAFAITWAWINFSWFASAYDTDDWIYRLTTMLQMVGRDHPRARATGHVRVDRRWRDREQRRDGRRLRRDAGRDGLPVGARGAPGPSAAFRVQARTCYDPGRPGRLARAARSRTPTVAETFIWVGVLILVEFAGPWVAERRKGGTPWHAHHIAERYGLIVIIALGEGIIGTIASLRPWSDRRDRAGRSTPGSSPGAASG